MKRHLILTAGLFLALSLPPCAAQKQKTPDEKPSDYQNRPAVFTVTNDVLMKDLPPFTATTGSFGNSLMHLRNGAFEPYQWRDRLWAEQDAANRIYSGGISGNGRFAGGFLDGAGVMVFRPINGKMTLVREDSVAPGGSVIEYWQFRNSQTVKPETHSYTFKWSNHTAPGSEVWFTVYAIDKAGNFSEPATPVKMVCPEAKGKGKPQNKTFSYRTPRQSDHEGSPTMPTGFGGKQLDNGFVEFSWNPVGDADLQGYLVGFTTTDPAKHRGQYLKLAGKAQSAEAEIKQGDWIVVAKEIRQLDDAHISPLHRLNDRLRNGFSPPLVSFDPYATPGKTWRLVEHPEDSPVETPGATYLELTLPQGESVDLSGNDISTTSQSYFKVPANTDYVVEVWLKADSADAKPVTFRVSGNRDIPESLPTLTFQPTTQWQHFKQVVPGKPPEQGGVGGLTLSFEGPGTYSVDNFRVYQADTPYLRFLPEDLARIEESGMEILRTHGPIKTETDTYSMAQFTNDNGATRGIKNGNTLPQMLDSFQRAGVDPWLQIEMHMTPDEWLGFVEYIAAPYDPATDTPESKPWAHKRFSQGYEQPWTQVFDEIYFEIANETWNWTFSPWVFEGMTDGATSEQYNRGAVYGMMNDWVIETLRSSPYWTEEIEEQFTFVLGGWMRSNYGWLAAEFGEHGDYYTIANYIRGWDGAKYDEKIASASPANFFELLQYAYQGSIPTAKADVKELLALREKGQDIKMGTYEAGPGYSFGNDQENEAQELVGKSKAAGTATLDNFLMLARYGFRLHNFFTYSEGERWSSHTVSHWGGQAYPSFLLLSLFNNHATGDLLDVRVQSVPTLDMPGKGRTVDVEDAPLADVYATRDGDRVSVFCISRQFPHFPQEDAEGFTPFQVNLPFSKAEKITLYRMTGDITANNIREKNVSIEEIPLGEDVENISPLVIDERTGGDARGLPPGETFLYVFEGTDMGDPGREVPLKEIYERPISFQPES